MNEGNRDRTIIDLDELERQLRESAGPRNAQENRRVAEADPLAELARIVEQDDPYRTLWSDGARGRVEPTLDREPAEGAPYYAPAQAQHGAAPGEDPFDHPDWSDFRSGNHPRPLLAEAARHESEYRQGEGEPVFAADGQLPAHDEYYADEVAPRSPRRRLLAAGAGLLVLVIGGGATAMLLHRHAPLQIAGGDPPVIQADTGPSKIQPENPGGLEVPNQDRQIYNRGPQDKAPVKIVGAAEQPVDVAQAPKADPDTSIIPPPAPAQEIPNPPVTTHAARPIAPVTTATTTTPQLTGSEVPPASARSAADSSVLAALAPRRVKTVSVRPDGTIIDPSTEPHAASAAGKVASLVDSAPMPAEAPAADVADAAPSQPARAVSGATPVPTPRPRSAATTATTATPAKVASAEPAAAPAAAEAAAPAPAKPKPAPVQTASTQPTAAAEKPAAAGGGFSVQLAAPASEQEARQAASRLQKRFAGELGDLKPAIRQAEVNGKTIWRVRVGSMAREDATNLCVKIQAAGGQCFVAKN